METTIKNLMHPSLVSFLNSLKSNTEANCWYFGEFTIYIEETGCPTLNLERKIDTEEEWIELCVRRNAPDQSLLFCDYKITDWTSARLISHLLDKQTVTVETVTDQFVNGKSMFYKKASTGYVSCIKAEAEWVSMPAGEKEQFLPMGYPLVFIELELSNRNREFTTKTPDMCANVDEFFRFYRKGQVELTKSEQVDGDGNTNLERSIVVDGTTYSVCYQSISCSEGSKVNEVWKKDGKLHRLSGPAVTNYHNPLIPSEGHLAQDDRAWYQNGVFIRSEDDTDGITASWHSAQREYFGLIA